MTSDFWDEEDIKGSTTSSSGVRGIRNQKLLRIALVGVGALSLVGLGASGVMYGVKQKPEWFGVEDSTSAEDVQKEVESIVAEVGELIELPEGEAPTLATVTDLDKVKDQSFFSKAQNGDKVLVYQSAKKAYLYRPSSRKIIEVGVVNINNDQNGTNGTGEVAGQATQSDIVVSSQTPTPSPESTISVTPANATPTQSPTQSPIL